MRRVYEPCLATVYGEEQSRWYFSPHACDHESFVASLDKSTEYQSQYEILDAINPGKYGVEWVGKIVHVEWEFCG